MQATSGLNFKIVQHQPRPGALVFYCVYTRDRKWESERGSLRHIKLGPARASRTLNTKTWCNTKQ